MPPRVAVKPSPEQLKAQYDQWLTTEEYAFWSDLLEHKKRLLDQNGELTETTPDLTGNYQPFLDKVFDFCKHLKVKTKIKEVRHEYIRTCFFAKQYNTIDGTYYETTKADVDSSYHTKHHFLSIYKALDEINDVDENTYSDLRKKMIKNYNDFLNQWLAP